MQPNEMIEAETMAKHFVTTRYQVGVLKGKRYPTWVYLKPLEKQVLIETFKAILGASTQVQTDENLQRRSNLRDI